MPFARSIFAVTVLFVACLFAQPQPPETARFRTDSATVLVDVIVLDGKGEVVRGLTADDFRVLENGSPMKIVSFEAPGAALPPSAAGAGRQGGLGPAIAGVRTETRFITLMLDLASTQPASRKRSIEAATEYVRNVIQPGDFVAVYTVGSRLRLAAPLTKDKEKIVEALASLSLMGSDGVTTAEGSARNFRDMASLAQQENSLRQTGNQVDGALADMARAERMTLQAEAFMLSSFQARRLYVALRALAQSTGWLPGRKHAVLFSEGFIPAPEASGEADAVIDAANRANLAIYVIDPSGLDANARRGAIQTDTSASMNSQGGRGAPMTANQQAAQITMQGPNDISGGMSKFDTIRRIGLDAQYDDLKKVAESTGGTLFPGSNDLSVAIMKIDREWRNYYTLAYRPENANYDGSFRRLQVNLVSGGRHRLRYRSGYWALPPGETAMMTPAAAQLLAGAAGGTLKSTIHPKLNAVALFNSDGRKEVPLSIWIPGEPAWAAKTQNGYSAGITMVVAARNAKGELAGVVQQTHSLRLTKQQWDGFRKTGLQLVASMPVERLEPLKLSAVLQFANGQSAQAAMNVDTSPSAETGARLTGLVVTSRVEVAKPSDEGMEALRVQAYQLVLPVEPVFASTEKLTTYFGIGPTTLDRATGLPAVTLSLRIKSGETVVRELPSKEGLFGEPNSPNVFYLNQYELAGLPAGPYTLEARVDDKAKNTVSTARAAFAIK